MAYSIFPTREEKAEDELEEILENLPEEESEALNGAVLLCYQGHWIPKFLSKAVISFQKDFVAKDTDFVIASCPKSGTTWLKALTFSIIHRSRFKPCDSPLLSVNPHDLVPFVEFETTPKSRLPNNIENMAQPRLFSTHTPYLLWPQSLRHSDSKVVYICRNPMDVFVSLWYFVSGIWGGSEEDRDVESHKMHLAFDRFCHGIHSFGPFLDHVLEFWNASLERPRNVLFLRYEDLKDDTILQTKRLAKFLGYPFSAEEEERGVIEAISNLCSLENLKNLGVNKHGTNSIGLPNSSFFRKGVVRDSKNVLTPPMIERLEKLMEEKYEEPLLKLMMTKS